MNRSAVRVAWRDCCCSHTREALARAQLHFGADRSTVSVACCADARQARFRLRSGAESGTANIACGGGFSVIRIHARLGGGANSGRVPVTHCCDIGGSYARARRRLTADRGKICVTCDRDRRV